MNEISASYTILQRPKYEDLMSLVELAGRTAYKSEGKIEIGSAERFIRSLIKRGHLSVLEHGSITVKFIIDRGVSHELVRHRIGVAYTQESTRYCNYSKKGLTVIDPSFSSWTEEYDPDLVRRKIWEGAMQAAEASYSALIMAGAIPEEARTVLPQSTKTEITTTANLREWRLIFSLRTAQAAHPQMREVMKPLLEDFKRMYPVFFEDL